MSSSTDKIYHILQLSQDPPEFVGQLIFTPSDWIGFDNSKKRTVVKYLFPPFKEEDEELLNDLLTQYGTAPESWTSYPANSLEEAKSLKDAEKAIKRLSKTLKTSVVDFSTTRINIEMISSTSLELSHIPKLDEIPKLTGNVEIGLDPELANGPSKSLTGVAARPKRNKTKTTDKVQNCKKMKTTHIKKGKNKNLQSSAELDNVQSGVDDTLLSISLEKEPCSDEVVGNGLSQEVSTSFETPTDIRPEEIQAAEEVLNSPQSVFDHLAPNGLIHNESLDDTSKTSSTEERIFREITNENQQSSFNNSDARIIDDVPVLHVSTPTQVSDLATKSYIDSSIEGLKEWLTRRFASTSQHITANATAINELRNTWLKSNEQENPETFVTIQDLKSSYDLQLPFESAETFSVKLDERLKKEQSIRESLRSYFKLMLNIHTKLAVTLRNILKSFFTRIALSSYTAQKESRAKKTENATITKKIFKDTQFCQMMIDIALSKLGIEESTFLKTLTEVMGNVKDWDGGRVERMKKSSD